MEDLLGTNNGSVLEYNWKKVNSFLEEMRPLFEIVRLVDPQECREIQISKKGMIDFGNKCYSLWHSDHRCANCTSLIACRTMTKRNRFEYFEGTKYQIQSVPVLVELADATKYRCNMEMINYGPILDKVDSYKKAADPVETTGYISTHDNLTGVLNWEGFCQQARELLNSNPNEDWIIISTNIHNFKLVNNLFGIEKGDGLLISIGSIFSEMSGEHSCVGRVSGDKFTIFMTYRDDIEAVLKKCVNKIKGLIKGAAYRLNLSIGIYKIKSTDIAISIMYDRAYMALQTIRNNHEKVIAWFDDDLLKTALHEQEVISDFEDNLKSGQFVIYLQPQINIENKIVGAECLVRWILPNGKMVPPFEFIGILEKSDLIASLDRYVWELAARQLDQWKNTEFEDLYLSINVSPLDFYYIDVPSVIIDICDKYDIPYEKLHVEITETAVADEAINNNKVIDQMQEKGFLIEIDDFGKGSSSLSLLKDLKADVLKIDMGFLRKSENTERGNVILKAVIDMAKSLKMEIITEGVETREQLDKLTELGCGIFQGYYFSKPIPVAAFENMIHDNSLAKS
ncbi:MAG: GGDEF domain-containing phosphodiesterase [Lachnospiraceae bacterium]|nr:GGDEF domain-containing phosphodiesterase [Lachnospiraceae bacterium]